MAELIGMAKRVSLGLFTCTPETTIERIKGDMRILEILQTKDERRALIPSRMASGSLAIQVSVRTMLLPRLPCSSFRGESYRYLLPGRSTVIAPGIALCSVHTPVNPQFHERHVDQGDVEFSLTITSVVSESAFHQQVSNFSFLIEPAVAVPVFELLARE